MKNKILLTKPIGKIATVGAVPGAIIIATDCGEVIAIDSGQIDQVIADIRSLLPFAENLPRYRDDLQSFKNTKPI